MRGLNLEPVCFPTMLKPGFILEICHSLISPYHSVHAHTHKHICTYSQGSSGNNNAVINSIDIDAKSAGYVHEPFVYIQKFRPTKDYFYFISDEIKNI